MQILIDVVLPVFLIIGLGYFVRWRNLVTDQAVDGLMQFAQSFALPIMLFRAASRLDLSTSFDLPLLASFFSGAFAGFIVAALIARFVFKRDWADCCVFGFAGMFSNTLLLGLPITERAYGAQALAGNYAIIALHSPLLYGLGVTVMEMVKNRGQGGSPLKVFFNVLKGLARTPLVVGLMCGFAVNLTGLPVPTAVGDAADMLSRAGIPAALFALGGVLYRYRPDGDMRLVMVICATSLVLHPAISYTLGRAFDLSDAALRSVVITAAMAPGVNAYLFGNMYGVGKRVSASAVLIGTALTVLTAWVWLQILP